jgi:predicted permease
MRLLRVLRMRIRSLAGRESTEAATRREMELHVEMLTRENIENGMSPEDARLEARRAMGNLGVLEDQSRDARGVRYLQDFVDDTVFAVRLLRKSPVFTAVAVLSLALGIGANTAIFTLIKRTFLDALPVREPERLVRINRSALGEPEMSSFSYPLFREMAAANTGLEGIIAVSGGRVSLSPPSGEPAEGIPVDLVSANYYEVLGVKPHLGRMLASSDDQLPSGNPVVVLNHNYWRRRFGSDPSIVGKIVQINTHPFTVVGVSPPGFDGLNQGWATDAVVPITTQAIVFQSRSSLADRGHWWLGLAGRLKPGVSLRQAELSLDPPVRAYLAERGLQKDTTDFHRKRYESNRVHVRPVSTGWHREPDRAGNSMTLLGITAIVLLAACTNLASLLLARASARRGEIAMRLTLGAGKFRIVRQLLTESLILAMLGGALGLAFAVAVGPVVVTLSAGNAPQVTLTGAPDLAVLLFCLVVTTVCGLLFGLAPAFQSIRSGGGGDSRTVAGSRLVGRKILLSVQVALTLVLLCGAALFVRTIQNMKHADLGLAPDHMVQFSLMPKNAGYADAQIPRYVDRVLDGLHATPGVQSATVSVIPVLANGSWESGISIEGKALPEGENPRRNAVGSRYFTTMGIPLLAGRDFEPYDSETGQKVAIVNESFARHYFGNESPIGRRIDQGGNLNPQHVIVGVAKDGKYRGIRDTPTRLWYIPYAQSSLRSYFTMYVRTAGDPGSAIADVRRAIANVDANVAVLDVRTLEEQIANGRRFERMIAVLSSFFGGLAVILAAIGLYGILAYLVHQRQREIGIRLALGASRKSVANLIVSHVAGWAILGVLLSLPAVLYGSRLVRDLLYGVEPGDPLAILCASGLLTAVAVASALIPARRAASIQPSVALRNE